MILFGAGGHCKVIIDLLTLNGQKIDKILDDDPLVSEIYNIPVFKNDRKIPLEDTIISIGDNKSRKKISELYGLNYISAYHQTASISNFAKIDSGTVVMPNSSIGAGAIIGKHCIINTNAVVEHDCIISDFVHISPKACLAGQVKVGEGTHLGIGANVIQQVNIGKWCVIGAGAVVLNDLPDYSVAVGNPAKIIKINDDN
ncbi:acetyltransferase [Halpernia frigidisoli]|uniref:Acetyltransferase EpsM n=1 Tax=Halpernia frigidisoli TaxID=1125876 RepID=A0A1I3FCA9_9FLAO|nr:acetyltransferase [Halpernia frigidisoli]SFI08868.1 acetyltransferase EpsM [Halpernia frigidisoli]